jgi:hypothetical protein
MFVFAFHLNKRHCYVLWREQRRLQVFASTFVLGFLLPSG